MLRVKENPIQRWPEGRSLIEDAGNWWVLYTKPRNEKALAWDLIKMGVGYYLPMTTKRTRRRDNGKPRKSVLCLFPGYISIVNYPPYRKELARTHRISRAIPVENQQHFIKQLEQIQIVSALNVEMDVNNGLAKGQRVLITSGPLQGIEGIILDFGSRERVYFNVEMFGRSVVVKMDSSLLIPI